MLLALTLTVIAALILTLTILRIAPLAIKRLFALMILAALAILAAALLGLRRLLASRKDGDELFQKSKCHNRYLLLKNNARCYRPGRTEADPDASRQAYPAN